MVLTCQRPPCNLLAATVGRLLSNYRTTHRDDSDFHVPWILRRRRTLLTAVMIHELVDYQNFHAHSPVDFSSAVTAQLNMRSRYVITKSDIINLVLRDH